MEIVTDSSYTIFCSVHFLLRLSGDGFIIHCNMGICCKTKKFVLWIKVFWTRLTFFELTQDCVTALIFSAQNLPSCGICLNQLPPAHPVVSLMTVLNLKQNIFVHTFTIILHNRKLIITLLQLLISLLILSPITLNSLTVHTLHQTL